MNVQDFLNESCEALQEQHEYVVKAQLFIEKWVPEVVNEIETLRNKVVLLETRNTELENEVDFLGGS
jgi:hypothetical protein